ncbi:hypothetical protein BS78_05G258500 [Paspalum vaginatum]|nr:hypothetical protein BS78_05G258500 [Paspalum vaginatum]
MQWQMARDMGRKMGFLDPSLINQSRHDWPLQLPDNHDKLAAGQTKKEEAIRHKLHKLAQRDVVSYLVNCLRFFDDEKIEEVLAPYNFDGHWICLYIMPKESKVLVLDSLDVDPKKYKTFMSILRVAFKNAMESHGLSFHPERKDKIAYRSYYPLPPIPLQDRPLEEMDLMNMIADLCRFTMREVINRRGEFFDHDGVLAKDDKFLPFVEWEYHRN